MCQEMETWLCFLPSLLALGIIQKEMSCFFCKQWNKSAAIVSHASSVLLCWRRRWDLDQFFICTSIVGIDNFLCRKQSFSMFSIPEWDRCCDNHGQEIQAGNWLLQIPTGLASPGAELIPQISLKSFIIAIMQDADKYWKEIYPARNDWSSPNPSESALTGIFLQAQHISLKVDEAVWLFQSKNPVFFYPHFFRIVASTGNFKSLKKFVSTGK